MLACWRRMRARDGVRNAFAANGLWRGRRKRPPVSGKIGHRAASPPARRTYHRVTRCLYTLRRWYNIVTPPRRRQGKRRTDRDGTEDIYLYTGSVGLRRSLHEPTRSSDDGKSCSGRRAPDVPVAGH